MRIKSSVYEALTPRQRIRAAFEALARGDEEEAKRLKETCPFKSYRQREATFSDTMEYLLDLSLAVEADRRGYALSFMWGLYTEAADPRAPLQALANMEGAWQSLLAEWGIRTEAMQIAGAPRHPLVEPLLAMAPEPEKEAMKEILQGMKGSLPA